MSTPIKSNQASLIAKRIRTKPPVLVPLGYWLKDAKEEAFCVLLADGVPLAIAFARAGFDAADKSRSALDLYKAKRIRDRVEAIIAARAAHPPVSLSEVTDMLKRVYVGAIHDTEYNSAHNAAFSLARLHGLVVDRAQLDVIRRPSREPDAPSEVALSDWIQRLPSLPTTTQVVSSHNTTEPLTIEGSAFGSDLDAPRDGVVSGNGAPIGPVTGTPNPGAHSGEVGSPSDDEGTTLPRAEDLF